MLYLGIDQHARQITISLRDEADDVVQARQVSTQPEKINAFFEQFVHERLRNGECSVAVLEVCGFNDWLIRMLKEYHCHKVILIQPEDRKKRKTDRRDAAALSELLWANRDRLLYGKSTSSAVPIRQPASDDAAQGGRASTDSPSQQDPAHPAAAQPAMGNAHQKAPHQVGDRLAEASGFALRFARLFDLSCFARNANGADVDASGSLTATLTGGNGMDDLSLNYSGKLQGTAHLSADGGNSKDSVSGSVSLSNSTDPGGTTDSTGHLFLDFEGGDGVDAIKVSLSGESNLASDSTFTINGGRSKDTFDLSANLTAVDPNRTKV
jgi:hypothetical protein